MPAQFLKQGKELEELTAFFAWTTWASVTNRPGEAQSYTNNFPYDPLAGNLPTSSAVIWSAISLIALLVGMALVLLAFGKFDYVGWKSSSVQVFARLLPGNPTPSQRAVMKFFIVVALLFLAQTLIGGATAHYRAEPESFCGIDLSPFLPSNILRAWHLAPGTCNWRYSGLPPPMSLARCYSRRISLAGNRSVKQHSSMSCSLGQ